MRILVLTNLYPPHYVGGYELRCRDVTESLHQRGHQVSVLTSNHQVSAESLEPSRPYTVDRSLRVHGFFGHPWLGIRDLAALEEHNNRVLLAAIQSFRPELIHVWNMGGISKSLLFTLQALGIPTVLDVSDHWIARSLKGDVWLAWWNRRTMSLPARLMRMFWNLEGRRRSLQQLAPTNPLRHLKFQRLYFCSRRLLTLTQEAGYPVAHGSVIHCPVDVSLYHGMPKLASQPMDKLLYVGRLSEDKGVFTALQAMRSLRGKFEGSLSVYGRGEACYEAMLKEYVLTHQLPVTFHQATPQQMPEVYRSHSALLFTSEWEEPFALTPLEAMACGLPVIGTMTGGSAELFQNGVNALTYDAGNEAELAAQILTLSSDASLREKVAIAGQQEVRRRFPLSVIVDEIEAFLKASLQTWQPEKLPDYNAR